MDKLKRIISWEEAKFIKKRCKKINCSDCCYFTVYSRCGAANNAFSNLNVDLSKTPPCFWRKYNFKKNCKFKAWLSNLFKLIPISNLKDKSSWK